MNNTTDTSKNCAAMFTDSAEVKIVKTVVLSVIMLLALSGNLFVLFVVYKKKNMRRTTNVFIANMSASDILIAVIVIPRILAELYIGPRLWIISGFLGSLLCKICFFFTDFCAGISITSHAVIAVDRFWAIVYSLRPSPITPARRKYIIALIWLYNLAVNSPNLYTYKLTQVKGKAYCRINWAPLDRAHSQSILFTFVFIFVLCIPLLLILVSYSWLLLSLTRKNILNAQTQELREKRRKEDITVLRNVAVMVTVFLVSLMPITILGVLSYYYWEGLPCNAWGFTFAAHILMLSNCAINPWLCIFLHQSYRKYLRKTLSLQKMTFRNRRDEAQQKQNVFATQDSHMLSEVAL